MDKFFTTLNQFLGAAHRRRPFHPCFLGILLLTLFVAPTAWASAILHVGSGYGTDCAKGGTSANGCFLYPTSSPSELINIGTPTHDGGYAGYRMDIFNNANSNNASFTSLNVIFGVPNETSVSSQFTQSITEAVLISPKGGHEKTAIRSIQYDGFKQFTSSDKNVYSLLGFKKGINSSNNFKNWWNAELAVNGIKATSFGVYQFTLAMPGDSLFGPKDYLDLRLNSIPEGTFAVAYGLSGGRGYSTPFTQTGLVDRPVPGPGALWLMATGLLALIIVRRRSAS